MTFTKAIGSEIESAARELGVAYAALAAVVEVESAGRMGETVDGRFEPVIRFEGHYFDRRLTPENRAEARRLKLASPTAGAILNPRSQAARRALVARAAAIDRRAAHESVSWGCGQVMGAHWAWLGYASVDALVAEARGGAGGQIRLMCRFIRQAGLIRPLAKRDWAAFARGYNGPAYAKNRYDAKLAAAFAKHAKSNLGTAARIPAPAVAAKAGSTPPTDGFLGWLRTLLSR